MRFTLADRAVLSTLPSSLPHGAMRRHQLLVGPNTILRWHWDLLTHRHAQRSRPKRSGRPRTIASIRQLILHLAHENPTWGYRRIHRELAVLGAKVVASKVWENQKDADIGAAPQRSSTTWAAFLRHKLRRSWPATSSKPSP